MLMISFATVTVMHITLEATKKVSLTHKKPILKRHRPP